MMKKERIGFMLLAFLAIFSFAGIYGGFVTGALGKIALIDPPIAGLCTTVDLSTGEYRQIIGYSQSPGVLKFRPSYNITEVTE